MYRILLVEDEKLELDTLKNYVNWEGCGIDQVYTARGARSALECINSVEIDIMITDIQMPGISGIELARIVREEGHNCKIVFLTGFDRFDYAREAVALHAEDFLLKPFQIDEVETLVTSLVQKIGREKKEKSMQQEARNHIIEQACRENFQDADSLASLYFQKSASEIRFHLLGIYRLEVQNSGIFQKIQENAQIFWMDPFWMVIYPVQIAVSSFLQRLQQLFVGKDIQIVYCEQEVSFAELYGRVHRIIACREDLFFKPVGTVMKETAHEYRKTYSGNPQEGEEKNLLLEAILRGNLQNAEEHLKHFLDSIQMLEREACCQNAFSLFLYLHNNLEKRGNMDNLAEIPNVLHARSFAELEKNLLLYIQQCCAFCQSIIENRMSYYVRRFVSMHYMEACTVEEMAEGINLSPNYLRKKFKEETGMTILEYVTEERLRIACDLLKDPAKKVKEVAVAVGYENISYFTQIFAKKYGVTPNEYRKSYS